MGHCFLPLVAIATRCLTFDGSRVEVHDLARSHKADDVVIRCRSFCGSRRRELETHIAPVALAPHPAIRKRIYVSQSPRRIFRPFPAILVFMMTVSHITSLRNGVAVPRKPKVQGWLVVSPFSCLSSPLPQSSCAASF